MWKITFTLTHPTNILAAKTPFSQELADKLTTMRIWSAENGLLDARDELINNTTLKKIYVWESQARAQAFREHFADLLLEVEPAMTAHYASCGITGEKVAEEI
jgi:hypothetical protein